MENALDFGEWEARRSSAATDRRTSRAAMAVPTGRWSFASTAASARSSVSSTSRTRHRQADSAAAVAGREGQSPADRSQSDPQQARPPQPSQPSRVATAVDEDAYAPFLRRAKARVREGGGSEVLGWKKRKRVGARDGVAGRCGCELRECVSTGCLALVDRRASAPRRLASQGHTWTGLSLQPVLTRAC